MKEELEEICKKKIEYKEYYHSPEYEMGFIPQTKKDKCNGCQGYDVNCDGYEKLKGGVK